VLIVFPIFDNYSCEQVPSAPLAQSVQNATKKCMPNGPPPPPQFGGPLSSSSFNMPPNAPVWPSFQQSNGGGRRRRQQIPNTYPYYNQAQPLTGQQPAATYASNLYQPQIGVPMGQQSMNGFGFQQQPPAAVLQAMTDVGNCARQRKCRPVKNDEVCQGEMQNMMAALNACA
jgi:hypothetical protein